MATTRTFTEDERTRRDAWTSNQVENDCDGCVEHYDGTGWTPAEGCPVHGLDCDAWWRQLNVDLDRRWPGTWS